ncbi:MAG: EF-P lysine aminoacylase GenX [Planctomycetota bacterium]|nr:MAG: EF-P lysine aminoacylase GenX [Planctomycetota bacterium]
MTDWQPTASWDALRRRAELLRTLRAFFDERGFIEVETPLLSGEVLVERHLDPLSTVLFDDPREPLGGRRMWLQTSPEAAMKRLVAAGGDAIYQVTRSFRGGERGRLHNPEFTIVEWYRRGDTMHEGMALLAELCGELLGRGDCERLTYGEAFRRYAGVDPFAADTSALAALATARGLSLSPEVRTHHRDDLLNAILAAIVEPRLGQDRPTLLYHYPASQAAVARTTFGEPPDDEHRVAERFELYVAGLELANGYRELTDADELERRMGAANDLRRADGKPTLPPAQRLLSALRAGLPDCTGVALGFDRLVMASTGAQSIDRVQTFGVERA